MSTAEVSRLPRRSGGIEVRRGDDGMELVGSHERHLVNETALALWQLCDGQTRPDEMIDAICALFDAPQERVEPDVRQVLDAFARDGLIEWVSGDRGGL